MAVFWLEKEVGAKTLSIRSDSQLVIAQVKGEYEVNDPLLVKYVWTVQSPLEDFNYDLERIPRKENGQADALAKLASAKVAVNNRTIIQETLHTPCVENIMCLEVESTWMTQSYIILKQVDCPKTHNKQRK